MPGEKINTINDSRLSRSFHSKKEQSKPLFFQARLTVAPVDDIYEREADEVANRVMEGNVHTDEVHRKPVEFSQKNIVLRKCGACAEEEEKEIQRKEASTGVPQVTDSVEKALNSPGQPLDDNARGFMEGRFGYDFSHVKIHTDSIAAESAQSINALAYTSGNSIVFNEGQYSPASESGKRLLAHELTHVVQQNPASVSRQEQPATAASVTSDNPAAGSAEIAEPQIVKAPSKKNLARAGMVPFSFVADKDLPAPKKNLANDPMMIWAIAKVFNLTEDAAASIVEAGSLVWYEDGKAYKDGETVTFKLSSTAISAWMGVLAAEGKIDLKAVQIFEELIALQSGLSHRDYSFLLLWLEKKGVPLSSITEFQNLTPENLERVKALIEEFNNNKYSLLADVGLLQDYLSTEDVIRDSRFEELKDLLFTKDLKDITAAEKAEVLKLFQDKALSTAFWALEEAKVISKREHDRYTRDEAALDEVVGIITGYSANYMKNWEARMQEFLKFRESISGIPNILMQNLPSHLKFFELQKLAAVYESRKSMTAVFGSHYRSDDVIRMLDVNYLTTAMAEFVTACFYQYAWHPPEKLNRDFYLPEDVNHPLFKKFRERFPKPSTSIDYAEIQKGCIPIVHEQHPAILKFDSELAGHQQNLLSSGLLDKHEILKDVSVNFGLMHDPAETKKKLMALLKDKPGKADETKARLLGDRGLIWEFQPMLYYLLDKEGLTKNHPVYKIVDEKIQAVADRNFWESIALAALGIVLAIAGIFTGGLTTYLGAALIAASATVGIYDFMRSYAEYQLHADAFDATLKVPFTTDPSSIGMILSIAGLVLDVGDVLKVLGKAAGLAAKGAKAGVEAADSITELLANSKNMDEYAGHLFEHLAKNNQLKPGITKEMFVKTLSENWESSQKLIESWTARQATISSLPDDIKAMVGSSEFMKLPVEIRESVFKLYDAGKDAFYKLMRSFSDSVDNLKAIGFQIYKNPEIAKVYSHLSELLDGTKFSKVVQYYSSIGSMGADALPEILNLMNKGDIFSNGTLSLQVLTNRGLQQILLHFHSTPASLRSLWNDFTAKYPNDTGAGFATYVSKETQYGGLMKMDEVSNPVPKTIDPTPDESVFTDALGRPPKPNALEGLDTDLEKLNTAVGDPTNIKSVTDAKYLDKYDVEVKVGDHTFRRNKLTGKWCRFSPEACNIDPGIKTTKAVNDAVGEAPGWAAPRTAYWGLKKAATISEDLFKKALEFRRSLGQTTEAYKKNISVLKYTTSDGEVKFIAKENMGSGAAHAEEMVYAEYYEELIKLKAQGKTATPLELFTDRVPCSGCKKVIKKNFGSVDTFYVVGTKSDEDRWAIVKAFWDANGI